MNLDFIYHLQYCIRTPGNTIMEKKDCFGILENVFPMAEKGLREVPPECFDCSLRLSCLREALGTREGVEIRSGILERAPAKGLIGRLHRWSLKKELSRMAKQEKKQRR